MKKNTIKKISITLLSIAILGAAVACTSPSENYGTGNQHGRLEEPAVSVENGGNGNQNGQNATQGASSELKEEHLDLIIDGNASLTEEEIQGLLFMREEEKLAGDVYRYLYDLWGSAVFEKKPRGASVKVDSEYSEEYCGNHLLDAHLATAWASGGTPMPHWAEITLAEAGEVEQIEVANRVGPYQITDLDIALPDGDGWRTVKSVRDAGERVILVKLDAPIRTDRVRVTISRELYQGQDRQHADAESIRVLDRAGRIG